MLPVTVTCSVSDYYHALLWRLLRRWDAWITPAVGIIFVVWTWRGGEGLFWSVNQGICVGIGVTLTLLSMPYFSARSVSKRLGFGLPMTWTFSDDDVTIEGAHSRTNARWILIKSVPETERCFLFRFTSGGFLIIPKGQLDADQTAALRQILRGHGKLS